MGLPELNYVDVTVNTQPGHYGLKFPSGVCVCLRSATGENCSAVDVVSCCLFSRGLTILGCPR